jgi:hypothetical protein
VCVCVLLGKGAWCMEQQAEGYGSIVVLLSSSSPPRVSGQPDLDFVATYLVLQCTSSFVIAIRRLVSSQGA